MKRVLPALWMTAAPCVLKATDYYWDPTFTGSGGGSAPWFTPSWDTPALGTSAWVLWPGSGGDNDAFLLGPAGSVNPMAMGNPMIFVNDITVDSYPGPGGGIFYSVSGPAETLFLNGTIRSRIDVENLSTLTIESILGGNSGFQKLGQGRLTIDNFQNNLTGGVNLSAGTLIVGGSLNSSNVALRSNDVRFGLNTSLFSDKPYDLSLGGISGFGYLSTGNHELSQLVLNNVNASTQIIGFGYNLQGAATQTYTGDLTGMNGPAALYGYNTNSGTTTATLHLSQKAALTSINELDLQGGSLILDNTAMTTSGGVATNRLADGATIYSVGGTLTHTGLLGLGADEKAGKLVLQAGETTINIVHNGGPNDTHLQLTSLNHVDTATINFTSTGLGTLGALPGPGDPRITFASIPALTPGQFIGPWATVNGGDYAKYDPARGVFAPDSSSPYDIITTAPTFGGTTAPNFFETLNQTVGTETMTGFEQVQALRINPAGIGMNMDINGNFIITQGILLAGNSDYLIDNSTSNGGIAMVAPTAGIYIGVADANTTLNISKSVRIFHTGAPSDTQSIVKYGDGFLNLIADNSASLNGITNFVIDAGTLRARLGPGGSLPDNGWTSLVFRGGVLEISNGSAGTGSAADFTNALGIGPKTVNWEDGSGSIYNQGSGGFSAFNGAATVNIGGGSAMLTWNDKFFVQDGHALVFGSTKANALLTFENDLNLDGSPLMDYHAREFRVIDNTSLNKDIARLSGRISGSANNDFLKTGNGTLQLTNKINTYSGNTIIHEGTLQLGAQGGTGAGDTKIANTAKVIINSAGTLLMGGDPSIQDRINDNAAIVMNGGKFNSAGYSEFNGSLGSVSAGMGTLTLSANSILDLGDASSIGAFNTIVAFAGSADERWVGALSIWNWTGIPVTGGGIDQLYFGGSSLTGLTAAQLSQIQFFSDNGITFLGTANWATLGTGEIVPVPEAEVWWTAGILFLWVGWRERKRFNFGSKSRLSLGRS